MLVFKNNYKQMLPLFKESLEMCDFLSFDCEMTGVTYDLKTDATKYDTPQFRYHKFREIVKQFELIQVGVTFYIRKEQEIKKDKKEGNEIEEETNKINLDSNVNFNVSETNKFYLERTFTFLLFKNSKLRHLDSKCFKKGDSIFSSFTTCHPAALKFLNENGFDLNNLVANGIHYNNLSNQSVIEEAVTSHIKSGSLPNSVLYLSMKNEQILLATIKSMVKFLLSEGTSNIGLEANCTINSDKRLTINSLNKFLVNYIMGLNFKKLTKLGSFSVNKIKGKENTLIVEKTKVNLNKEDFNKTFSNFESFCDSLDFNTILKAKYSGTIPDETEKENLVDEELGFSVFIRTLIERNKTKPVAIVGHNILFDLLFIYDKFVESLPENFYEFKFYLNKIFPLIYDNKFLTTCLAKEFENTKLESLYINMKKRKFDAYVDIIPDLRNGFSAYSDTESKSFHDAGYDSVITGRCFIYLLKAVENSFQVDNKKQTNQQLDVVKNAKSVSILNGFVDLTNKELTQLCNKTVLSMMERPFDVCDFDTSLESHDDFYAKETKIINNLFGMVYVVRLKEDYYTIYDFARRFENDHFNISVVKIDDCVSFVNFIPASEHNFLNEDEKLSKLDELLNTSRSDETVIEILPYAEFMKSYDRIIKF